MSWRGSTPCGKREGCQRRERDARGQIETASRLCLPLINWLRADELRQRAELASQAW